ncbi:MAG: adenine methylase [Thermoanaerobacteraceae bacterium]|nr:adenine methylase [Thermoanaerobacteraceae bacterium]
MLKYNYFTYYGGQFQSLYEINLLILSACEEIVKTEKTNNNHGIIDINTFADIIFIDCFAGAGNIIINRPPIFKKAILNELNEDIYLLHKLMSDSTKNEELIRRLSAIPYSKEVFEEAKRLRETEFDRLDEFQKAEVMFTLLNQSFNGAMGSWSNTEVPKNYNDRLYRTLQKIKQRYEGVEVKNDDGLNLIEQYKDEKHVILFLDPPYLQETRSAKNVYELEFTREQHERLLYLVKDAMCKIILLGYKSDLYDSILLNGDKGWRSFVLDEIPLSCQNVSLGEQKRKVCKHVWINFEPNDLAKYKIVGLREK